MSDQDVIKAKLAHGLRKSGHLARGGEPFVEYAIVDDFFAELAKIGFAQVMGTAPTEEIEEAYQRGRSDTIREMGKYSW